MKARQLEKIGIPAQLAQMAKWTAADARKRGGLTSAQVRSVMAELVADPAAMKDDEYFGELAVALEKRQLLAAAAEKAAEGFEPRATPAPWQQWGEDLDENSIEQMRNACQLPVSVRGALMPDAHLGYGLPIGGVLATDNAVIPYAVGVDIACRMKLTVLDMPVNALKGQRDRRTDAVWHRRRVQRQAARTRCARSRLERDVGNQRRESQGARSAWQQRIGQPLC
jgi:tRNA-splicing ligase RtcB